jgi:diacylglycerol kinase (ATP)
MIKQHILFVINPHSGTILKDGIPALIREKGIEHGFDHSLFETTGKDDHERLEEAVAQLCPSIVAAVGGDGTCNLVARVVKNTPVKIGIIPAGSANGMAYELGIPKDLGAAIDLLMKGAARSIDAVLVNEKYISIHLADVGLNAKIIKRFEKEKRRGLWGYARQLLREMFYVRKYHFEVSANGHQFHRTAISITFANATRFGTGAIINPGGKLDDGKFELCIIRAFPVYHLLTLAIKFFTGRINDSKYINIVSCSEAVVRCRKRITLQVDGEVIGKTKEVRIQALPAALLVIAPPLP